MHNEQNREYFDRELIRARYVKRLNRFSAQVKLWGKLTVAYLPNPGRLQELLQPNVLVFLRPERKDKNRKSEFTLVGVRHDGINVSVDSKLPNKFFYEAIKRRLLPPLKEYDEIIKEPRIGNSRLDFQLIGKTKTCYVEVKSCTLVVDGVAKFPDAPTERGRRHLRELMEVAKKRNSSAAIVFIVQRDDAHIFKPNAETDPEFARTLRLAMQQNVQPYCFLTRWNGTALIYLRPLPLKLD